MTIRVHLISLEINFEGYPHLIVFTFKVLFFYTELDVRRDAINQIKMRFYLFNFVSFRTLVTPSYCTGDSPVDICLHSRFIPILCSNINTE